jgi:hypothetical protein
MTVQRQCNSLSTQLLRWGWLLLHADEVQHNFEKYKLHKLRHLTFCSSLSADPRTVGAAASKL